MFRNVLRRRIGSADRLIALDVMRSFAAMVSNSDPDPNIEHVLEQLEQHALALANLANREAAPELLQAIHTACSSALAVLDRHRKAQQQDTAAFIETVRDAELAMAAHGSRWNAALAESLRRLESECCEDITQLRSLVAEEASAIRARLADHESEQQARVANLSRRLALRQEQLKLSADETFLDPLTRVSNRRGFDLALAKWIQELDPATPIVLALFDVDSLRTLNMELGQCAGDAVLRHVAGTIRQAVRQCDVVARIGGDEFVLVASGLTLLRAQGRLRQILGAIADASMTVGGDSISVTCGAAELSAGDSIPSLLHRADMALQEAKRRGRGSVVTRTAPSIRSHLHPAVLGKTA
jgi:diguanylate cyclase (GGDEF)-like protein